MNDTHVYLISEAGDEGPIKVGISHGPRKRLLGFQTANPFELRIVHSFPMPSRAIAKEIERSFHETQKEHRLRGEWFDLSAGDALVILCMAISSALHYKCPDLSADKLELCFEKCGLNAAYGLSV
jgi:hypothetical protein